MAPTDHLAIKSHPKTLHTSFINVYNEICILEKSLMHVLCCMQKACKGVGYLFIGEMNTQYIEYLHVLLSLNPLPVPNIYNYVVVYHMQSQFIAKYEKSHLVTRKNKTSHNSSRKITVLAISRSHRKGRRNCYRISLSQKRAEYYLHHQTS
jgi:hypothetical protein